MQSLFIFAFVAIAFFGVKSKKSKNLTPMFSSRSLIVPGIMIKYSVHFELIFVCDVR